MSESESIYPRPVSIRAADGSWVPFGTEIEPGRIKVDAVAEARMLWMFRAPFPNPDEIFEAIRDHDERS